MARRVDPVVGPWRVDLHSHTYVSPDSATNPRDLVERARALGLAKLAVTDHNTIEGAREAYALAPDLIIVGQEIDTEWGGELIAYFVTEQIPRDLHPHEAIQRLREQGAVISISHPLDRLRGSAMGEQHTLALIDQVDALEVFNARCLLAADNRRAAALAAQYGKLGTAGSDGHTLPEIGAAYVQLPPFKGNSEAFKAALAKGQAGGVSPVCCPMYTVRWRRCGRNNKFTTKTRRHNVFVSLCYRPTTGKYTFWPSTAFRRR